MRSADGIIWVMVRILWSRRVSRQRRCGTSRRRDGFPEEGAGVGAGGAVGLAEGSMGFSRAESPGHAGSRNKGGICGLGWVYGNHDATQQGDMYSSRATGVVLQ